MKDAKKIETRFNPPPIPIRQFDWEAVREGWDLGDPVGFGASEEEAIQNLLELEDND